MSWGIFVEGESTKNTRFWYLSKEALNRLHFLSMLPKIVN
jgi:hypothetical protein